MAKNQFKRNLIYVAGVLAAVFAIEVSQPEENRQNLISVAPENNNPVQPKEKEETRLFSLPKLERDEENINPSTPLGNGHTKNEIYANQYQQTLHLLSMYEVWRKERIEDRKELEELFEEHEIPNQDKLLKKLELLSSFDKFNTIISLLQKGDLTNNQTKALQTYATKYIKQDTTISLFEQLNNHVKNMSDTMDSDSIAPQDKLDLIRGLYLLLTQMPDYFKIEILPEEKHEIGKNLDQLSNQVHDLQVPLAFQQRQETAVAFLDNLLFLCAGLWDEEASQKIIDSIGTPTGIPRIDPESILSGPRI